MKIFLVCPVRGISDSYRDGIERQVKRLEDDGHSVYWPHRDTHQSQREIDICSDNLEAIKGADVVYVIWDGKSQGVLFDLGMAFALGKPVRTVTGYMPRMSISKSFQNMVFQWEDGL